MNLKRVPLLIIRHRLKCWGPCPRSDMLRPWAYCTTTWC